MSYRWDTICNGQTDGRMDGAILVFLPKFLWGHKNRFFLNMESAPKNGICELLWHEKIPETHFLATLLTRNVWMFNVKCKVKWQIYIRPVRHLGFQNQKFWNKSFVHENNRISFDLNRQVYPVYIAARSWVSGIYSMSS